MKKLRSKHDETDTRIIFHTDYIRTHCQGVSPITAVRSCDTDIFVLLLHHQNHMNIKFWMDTGIGSKNTRRRINVADLVQTLTSPVYSALPAFYAFTDFDYTAAFPRKAKTRLYDPMIKNSKYLSACSELGANNSVPPEVQGIIEAIVICMASMMRQI